MLESAITYLQQADPFAVYAFLFLIAFVENVVPPIPGDIPIAFIGYLIFKSQITFAGALFWSSLGSTSGFMLVFLLSKYLGLKLVLVVLQNQINLLFVTKTMNKQPLR